MRVTQIDPFFQLAYGQALGDSVWRYEMCLNLIEESRDSGKIEFFGEGDYPSKGSAGWLIDFLNPKPAQRGKGYGYEDFKNNGENIYYKPAFRDVDGIHAIMNNTDLQIKGLFNYLDDPWVGFDLKPLLKWYYKDK